MAQYKEGVVSVTGGSPIVLGSGTAWLGQVTAGDLFILAGERVSYTVTEVQDHGTLILQQPYVGDSQAASGYAIARDFTAHYDLPLLQPGDVMGGTLFSRAMARLDQVLDDLANPGNLSLAGTFFAGMTSSKWRNGQHSFYGRNTGGNTLALFSGVSPYMSIEFLQGTADGTDTLRGALGTNLFGFADDSAFCLSAPGKILLGSGEGVIQPAYDGVLSLGAPTARLNTLYAVDGMISTSDGREKDCGPDGGVAPLSDAEIAWSKALLDEIGTFRFLAAIAEKGEQARVHIGLTVQRTIALGADLGLDPFRYAFVCRDVYEVEGQQQERFGLRSDELALFLLRGLASRLSALEAQ